MELCQKKKNKRVICVAIRDSEAFTPTSCN